MNTLKTKNVAHSDTTSESCKDDIGLQKCNYCRENFISQRSLSVHIRNEHRAEHRTSLIQLRKKVVSKKENVPVSKAIRQLSCVPCELDFKEPVELLEHVKKAHSESSAKYHCDACRLFNSFNRSTLLAHRSGNKCWGSTWDKDWPFAGIWKDLNLSAKWDRPPLERVYESPKKSRSLRSASLAVGDVDGIPSRGSSSRKRLPSAPVLKNSKRLCSADTIQSTVASPDSGVEIQSDVTPSEEMNSASVASSGIGVDSESTETAIPVSRNLSLRLSAIEDPSNDQPDPICADATLLDAKPVIIDRESVRSPRKEKHIVIQECARPEKEICSTISPQVDSTRSKVAKNTCPHCEVKKTSDLSTTVWKAHISLCRTLPELRGNPKCYRICPECKINIHMRKISAHLAGHTEQPNAGETSETSCPKCHIEISQSSLLNHVLQPHATQYTGRPRPNRWPRTLKATGFNFGCSICGMLFPSESRLEKHKQNDHKLNL